MDADFPDLDLALRRGRHVDREDTAWYALLSDAQEQLEPFYRRYGCELIHKTDGYFYLLPTGDKISRKQLSPSDMLVGQALALLYLDPTNIERGGMIAHEDLIAQLSSVLGTDALIAAFNPGTGAGKRKKYDERIAQRNVRSRVAESVRRLAAMGFVDTGPVEGTEGERVKLRPALMRFAEPVRGLSEPAEALAKLVARGEVALTPEELEEAAAESGEEPVSGVAPRPAAEPAAESDASELTADVESSGEGAPDAPPALLDVESAGAGIDDVELEPAYAADIDAAEELGIADHGPGADAESFGTEADAQPVHPMDRDLDWADILPDPEAKG
jgi:chromosome partition protein MukE